jgi:hypothetical protein
MKTLQALRQKYLDHAMCIYVRAQGKLDAKQARGIAYYNTAAVAVAQLLK